MCGIPGVRSSIDTAIIQISVSNRGHLLCLVEHTTITFVVALVSVREAGANLHDAVDIVIQVDAAGVAVELITLHQTFIIHSGHRHIEVGLLVTTLNRYFIVLRYAVVENHIEPVGI